MVIPVQYRSGDSAFGPESFVALAQRVWPRDYNLIETSAALKKTINVGAWAGDLLVGTVRILSDGYFFNVIPELMVDPEFQRRGIGRELMYRAIELAPGGHLFLGAKAGNEEFFARLGFKRGPVGLVGRRAEIVRIRAELPAVSPIP